MKIFADLNDTLIISQCRNPDLAVACKLDKEFPGIFRYVLEKISDIASWEDRITEAFKALNIFEVPRSKYLSAAENIVKRIEVPEAVKKSFDRVSDVLTGVYAITGNSQDISDLILEKKLKPLLPGHVELRGFGTELYVDELGYYTGKIKKIYGYCERVKLVRNLKNSEVSINIADNYSSVNQGMIREGDYGILLSKAWDECDRKGNVFYVRPNLLHVAIDQVLREMPVYRWINRGVTHGGEINPKPVCIRPKRI
jgi:hypothetical protein